MRVAIESVAGPLARIVVGLGPIGSVILGPGGGGSNLPPPAQSPAAGSPPAVRHPVRQAKNRTSRTPPPPPGPAPAPPPLPVPPVSSYVPPPLPVVPGGGGGSAPKPASYTTSAVRTHLLRRPSCCTSWRGPGWSVRRVGTSRPWRRLFGRRPLQQVDAPLRRCCPRRLSLRSTDLAARSRKSPERSWISASVESRCVPYEKGWIPPHRQDGRWRRLWLLSPNWNLSWVESGAPHPVNPDAHAACRSPSRRSSVRIGKSSCDGSPRPVKPVRELATAFGIGRATAYRYLAGAGPDRP